MDLGRGCTKTVQKIGYVKRHSKLPAIDARFNGAMRWIGTALLACVASAQECVGTAGDVGGVPGGDGGTRDQGSVEPHGEDEPPSCEWAASVVEQVDGAGSSSRADGELHLRSAMQMESRWGRMAVLLLCREECRGRLGAVLAASWKRLAQEARRRRSRRPTLEDRWKTAGSAFERR